MTEGEGVVNGRQEGFVLLGDQPNVEQEDSLGFDAIARDLAYVIATSAGSTPFTLGIEGGWGQGKSSLMGRIDQRLPEVAPEGLKVTTARFNAWTAGDGDVLEGLVKAVLDQLDEKILRKVARNKRLISWARAGVAFCASVLNLGSVVDRVWAELDVDPKARNEMRDVMAEALRRWRDKETVLDGDRLLVVFVDDLDRCSPEGVFQVFEAMKLYLDAPGLAFVVGLDSGIVSDAILHEKSFSEEIKGDHYLEKVIQIRYRLPTTSDQNARALIESYMRDSGTQGLFDEAAQTLVVERNERNPRRIKRFINSFILEFRIDREWRDFGPEALIRVLILDFYFGDFAKLLRGRGEREPIQEVLDYATVREHLAGADEQLRQEVHRAPRVRRILASYGVVPDTQSPLPHDAVERLREELPEETTRYLGDPEFVSLLDGFGDEDERERLWAKLQRREVPDSYRQRADGEATSERDRWAPTLAGLKLLWLDDEQERHVDHMGFLGACGVELSVSSTYSAAKDLGSADGFDAVISDIAHGGNPRGGLEEVARMRGDGYDGPVMFFTTRVTSTRRNEADMVGAEITNDWSNVLDFLGGVTSSLRGEIFMGPDDDPIAPSSGGA